MMTKLNYHKEYLSWIKHNACEAIEDSSVIKECFSKSLKFGTGGLRAIMGPGPNRLNLYTIRKATAGFSEYLLDKFSSDISVVIAYDNRRNSKKFATESAKVLSKYNIKVYLFDDLRPTPELSFAVRHMHANAGIVITASHNPPEYNGFKTYDNQGCQSPPSQTNSIIEYIDKIDDIFSIEVDTKMKNVEYVGSDVDNAYYQALLGVQERTNLEKNIKIVYSPLHGTGNIAVTHMLKTLGYDCTGVASQQFPDENYINTESPNPEDPASFKKAIKLAKKIKADIIIVTDPDCDRLGVACKHEHEYKLLTGNQTGAILIKYLLESKIEKGKLPKNGIIYDTIVTGSLGGMIARSYGIETYSTLTGFKYIGEQILKNKGKKEFIFGYEESYGYLIKDLCLDKDAVQASILVAEAAQFYLNNSMTLFDVLNKIYQKYGYATDIQESVYLPGIEGQNKINKIMEEYRYGDISNLEGRKVIAKEDYLLSKRFEENKITKLTLPKSNVLKFFLEDGSWVVVRPSGNEPKLKTYKNLLSDKPSALK